MERAAFAWIALLAALLCAPARSQSYSQDTRRADKESPALTELRQRHPELANLDAQQVVHVIRQVYYPDMTLEAVAGALGVTLTAPKIPKPLGVIDRWRYESCLTDAARNPTTAGVQLARLVCDQKFGQ